MKVSVVGGGPGGLYFSLLLKKALPDWDVTIIERNPAGATYGWGVVFSDRTLTSFREADFKTYEQITDNFIIWDAIDISYRDQIVRCGGQVFSGIARKKLLGILTARCEELGVKFEFEREVQSLDELDDADLVIGADGVRSVVRETFKEVFKPRVSLGKARYIWFGTERVLDSFTFAFRSNDHGFFQAHAYPFDGRMSTFIVECSEETWRNAGLDTAPESAGIAYCEELFRDDLRGHKLMSNNSKWINFVNLRNSRWHHKKFVLLGDAAHTAHFSIGSGTKLAMEDSIALVNSLTTRPDLSKALVDYQLERKPRVERFQDAARQSQTYFENTSRYRHMEPLQFAFHLLSRSGRMDYPDLRVRDRRLVARVDALFSEDRLGPAAVVAPPAALSEMSVAGHFPLPNRVVVVAQPAYSAVEGIPHPDVFVGLGSQAGLVLTETVAISAHGRVTPKDPGLYTDEHVGAWKKALHSAPIFGDSLVGVTLSHSGPRGATRPRTSGTDRPLDERERWTTIAASPMTYARGCVPAVEIDDRRMGEVLEDYVAATERAGGPSTANELFDFLELHMGHGYLLASFISPLTNHRTDRYGGSLENRLRYPLTVVEAVRALWRDKPMGVALSVSDWTRGGLRESDAVAVARRLRDAGVDFIRVLAGQTVGRYRPQYDPYVLTYLSDRIRNEARIATIATGDISTVDHANTIVAGGRADLCQIRIDPPRHADDPGPTTSEGLLALPPA